MFLRLEIRKHGDTYDWNSEVSEGGGGEGGRVNIWNFLKGWTKVYSLKTLTLWT